MVMKKSGRGSVGRSFNTKNRYDNDKEFREKRSESCKEYYQRHKEERIKQSKEYWNTLKIDLDKRCNKSGCNKLLDPKNKSGFCKKHIWEHKRTK